MNKSLVLLCDNYPVSGGEFFIDDEVSVIAGYFKMVYVLLPRQVTVNLKRKIPKNLEVVFYDLEIGSFNRFLSFRFLSSGVLVKEFFRAITKFKIPFSIKLFKVLLMDMIKAKKLSSIVLETLVKKELRMSEVICYSYWHDYKALAISFLKRKYSSLKCVARAHRWDVYFEENSYAFLPYKEFIVKNLDLNFVVSQDAKNYFLNLLGNSFDNKIVVSRLGKDNGRKPLLRKEGEGVLICSCSTLTPVKRVSEIIEVLSCLTMKNIRWVHFGDGFLRKELEELARKKLCNMEYEFFGLVDNEYILEFYASNYVDLFVNLSSSEGIPVSIMEAQSAGIPVVAKNVGGNLEIVNKTNGIIVQSEDSTQDIVCQMISHLYLSKDEVFNIRLNAYRSWLANYCGTRNYNAFAENLIKL